MPRDSRRGTGIETLGDARERAMREDSGQSGLVVSYQSPGGPRPLTGDENLPYVMVPNEVSEPYLYSDQIPGFADNLYDVGSLTPLPEIDVRGFRRLTFFVQFILPYFPEAPLVPPFSNALMFLPQVANEKARPYVMPNSTPVYSGDKQWFAISVVDPVLRGMTPTVTAPTSSVLPVEYALRNVYMTQLNIPYPSTEVQQRVEIEATLVFDVAPYEWFRLRVAKTDDLRGPDTNTRLTFPVGGVEVCRIWAMKER